MARRIVLAASCIAAASGLVAPRVARPQRTPLSGATLSDDRSLDVECLVVGGGISGSTLAHALHVRGVDVVVAEARDYLGGNVVTGTKDGFTWEEGPNSFATQPAIVRAASELGIADELVFADESLPPWVFHSDTLHPLPKGNGGTGAAGQLELVFGKNGLAKFALAGNLLSWPGKIRAGIGAFLGHASPPEGVEETIEAWVRRTLGEEVFLRCVDPFVSGVYAGDPQTLSVSAALPKIFRIEAKAYAIDWNKFGALFYGGLVRQVELAKERKAAPPDPSWPKFEYGNPGSFRRGLATLPRAISAELGQDPDGPPNADARAKLGWKLKNVERREEGGYAARFDAPGGPVTVRCDALVSTVPAHALGDVFGDLLPAAGQLATAERSAIRRTGVHHPPLYAVTVAYPKTAFRDVELPNGFGNLRDLPGFGSLNPRTEGVRTLGTLWSSSLFPGRCPPDYNVLLNYIGGSRDPKIADLDEAGVLAAVDAGCRQVLLKKDAPPPKLLCAKLWPQAIPQYELGHAALLDALEKDEAKTPGLSVCGNYRSGVAFPDCVAFGYDRADKVAAYLGKK